MQGNGSREVVGQLVGVGPEPGEQAPGQLSGASERLRLPLPWIRERRHALRERQQFPEPVARITPTVRRGPYPDPGTGPLEAPARRLLTVAAESAMWH